MIRTLALLIAALRPAGAALAACLMAWSPALAGDRPDPTLTPGVARPGLTATKICATAWGKDARAVTAAMKRDVMASYRFTSADCPSGKVEIDHLISRELGGADAVKNLWPQCYEAAVAGKTPSESPEPGAHKKDRLENAMHKELCAAPSDELLAKLQKEIATDWLGAYVRRFGEPGR